MRSAIVNPFATALCIVSTLFAVGCGTSRPTLDAMHRLDLPAHSDSPALDEEVFGQLLRELRSGDIILCCRDDPISVVQRLTTVESTYFLHSGTIEIVEHAGERSARVWHSTGAFDFLKFSPHMLGKVRGAVQHSSFEEFLRNYDVLAIIRMPDPVKNVAIVEACRRLHEQRVDFDPWFDCVDHSSLCCTEFTAVTIEMAGYDVDIEPAARTGNPALSALLNGWNVTVPGIVMAGQFERLVGARTVGVISRYGRMETYLAFRDASALLHERVAAGTAEARDFTGLDGRRLMHFSPRMTLFMRSVEGLAIASPTMDAAEIRRRNEIVYQAVFSEDER